MECTIIFIAQRRLTNRGFLIGPYLPIYGVASITMIICLTRFKNNIFLLFLLSVLLCSTIEYLTSYLMEKLFKARWWDYSQKKFNLQGRICLQNALAFGIMGVILVKYTSSLVTNSLDKIPHQVLIYIALAFFIVFIIDVCLSFCIMNRIKDTITSIMKEDSSSEMTSKVKKVLKEKATFFKKRLLNAFPDFKIPTFKRKK
jgi:uncharacterized membrane protein